MNLGVSGIQREYFVRSLKLGEYDQTKATLQPRYNEEAKE